MSSQINLSVHDWNTTLNYSSRRILAITNVI